jgi:branched-chain amino acid transport system substrate-binding protein
MARRHVRAARTAAVSALAAVVAAACSSITGTGSTSAGLSGATGQPITIGISLPLTKDFAADGLASQNGYQLWASDVNAHGGLLGRPVKLIFRDDKSDPNVTKQDYTALITQDHVDLTMAPFSSLLTVAAAQVTDKYHYVLTAGSAGAPTVYYGSHYLFSTNVPVATQMEPVVNWIKSLPLGARPKTAAYPMVDDPFADPPVQATMKALPALGVQTVYSQIYNASSTPAQLARDAAAVAAKHPDMVVLGSVDVPTVSAFINTFAKMGVNPKIFIAAAGPDQGQAFINQVGTGNAPGVMVPNGWYGAFPNALSHVMVQDYIAKFGGTASDINADVAEAYSAGQTLAAGVTGAGQVSNGKIAQWLHSHEVQTVLGPVKFDARGENLDALNSALIFQWQPGQHFVQVLPGAAAGSVQPTFPKPNWGG